MVLGWRKAFCTSIPKEQEQEQEQPEASPTPKPKLTSKSRFTGFFSNQSTPRLHLSPLPSLRCRTAPPNAAVPSYSAPQSPKLKCKTIDNTPKFFHRSNPSSPSTFSSLKSSLRLTKSRCGICFHKMKTGQGTAIFTAECGHSFQFPCVGGSLSCPICTSTWKDMHSDHQHKPNIAQTRPALFKVYNDDEPLLSPTSGERFNPIPESDEETADDFPGFLVGVPSKALRARNVEIALLPESAVVSVGKTSETYAIVLKIRAPAAIPGRAPIDLVAVLNVSRSVTAEKLHLMKKAMRLIVSSLSAADRLSIVAFSTTSKRLLPLRRMTTAGRRSARRIIDAILALDDGATCGAESLKKAFKVLEDRREVNPTVSVVLLTDCQRGGPPISSTTFPASDIPIHTVILSACLNDDSYAQSIVDLLSVVVEDLKFQLGFTSGSTAAEISAVYSQTGAPAYLGSGSSWCRVGDLHPKEERIIFVELKVPSSGGPQKRHLSIRCSYKDSLTQNPICDKERPLAIPPPRSVGSSSRDAQCLRCLFSTTRAVAESRRLGERNDVAGARHMLASARALILQTGSYEELVQQLETELNELSRRRKSQMARRRETTAVGVQSEEIAEPLTPASAWKAAERLAKVAIMKKSLNRVSDLHGFENAGF